MPTNIKVMTYNIQLGAGSNSMARYIYDWLSISLAIPHSSKNIEKIIEGIESEKPDILTVTESENVSIRSSFENYSHEIARCDRFRSSRSFKTHLVRSKRQFIYKKAQENAIFTKSPHEISSSEEMYFSESEQRRGVGIAEVLIHAPEKSIIPIYTAVTHLSVSKKYRKKQIEELVDFVGKKDGLKIITGDFNIKKDESELNPIKEKYQDAGPLRTWPSWGNPKYPMDRIFVSKEFDIVNSFAPKVRGSDHLPLVAILRY